MKSNHGTRRSTLDSFETNLRQFQETNKLLTNIENKLTDIANNSKEGISPYSQAAHLEDDEPGTSVKGFHYDDQDIGYTSQDSAQHRGSHANNSFNKVQNIKNHKVNSRLMYESQPEEYESYNGEEQSRVYEYDEDGRSSVIQDNRTEKMMMTPQHDAGQRLSTKNYTSQRVGTGNTNQFDQAFLEMQAMTNSRKATNKTQMSNSGSRAPQDRTAKLESFYQSKIGVLEERVHADEREIYELRKFNEDLRLEVTRLRAEVEKSRQVQSEEIWQNFREQKESLQKGMLGEGARRSHGERGSQQQQQRGSERLRSTGKKYPQQFEYRKLEKGGIEDMWRRYNERGTASEQRVMTEERQSANRSEAQEFVNEDEKLGFLFGLINGYKQEVDLLKESNLLIQEKLQQEIYYLKKDLDSQRGQNMQMAKALQKERRNSQSLKENSEFQSVKSSKQSKGDFIEQMSKDELAKFTKSLQDNLMNLEEKHKQQVKYNETIQKELNELRVKTKEEVRQFDEAYHKIFDGQNVANTSGTRREERNSETIRNISMRKSYKENGVNTSPPVKDKKISPRKISPRKISPRKGSPRKNSPDKKRTFRDTMDSEYTMHPKLQSHGENERTRRTLSSKGSKTLDSKRKTSRENVGNKSFENYDGFIDEIKRVKRTVQGKIAEKSEERLNKTVTCSEVVMGKYGVPLRDGGKRKRSKSKGRSIDLK